MKRPGWEPETRVGRLAQGLVGPIYLAVFALFMAGFITRDVRVLGALLGGAAFAVFYSTLGLSIVMRITEGRWSL